LEKSNIGLAIGRKDLAKSNIGLATKFGQDDWKASSIPAIQRFNGQETSTKYIGIERDEERSRVFWEI
jgi:hypothetical protein